jgi:hypothetical protein
VVTTGLSLLAGLAFVAIICLFTEPALRTGARVRWPRLLVTPTLGFLGALLAWRMGLAGRDELGTVLSLQSALRLGLLSCAAAILGGAREGGTGRAFITVGAALAFGGAFLTPVPLALATAVGFGIFVMAGGWFWIAALLLPAFYFILTARLISAAWIAWRRAP